MKQVGVLIDYKAERLEAWLRLHQTAANDAHAAFDKTAAVLAGEDKTLRRVLRAALTEAFQRGYSLPGEEERALWDWERERYA